MLRTLFKKTKIEIIGKFNEAKVNFQSFNKISLLLEFLKSASKVIVSISKKKKSRGLENFGWFIHHCDEIQKIQPFYKLHIFSTFMKSTRGDSL